MEIERIENKFTVCKVSDISQVDLGTKFFFLSRTDEEISLVCPTESTPRSATVREDG